LTCETRTYVAQAYETYLNDPRNFDFEPVLSHEDIDERNTLVDPETGDLTGVIDFGDAVVGDPANDFTWAFCIGFAGLGIEDQLHELLREGGIDEARLVNRPAFFAVLSPVNEILHGLDIGDEEFVELGLERLNAAVPRDLRCVESTADRERING
jgi:aminoglycoside 2''-phosphotransferase